MNIEEVLREMRDPSADNERLLWADAIEAEIEWLTGTLDRLRIAYAELEKEKDAEIERLKQRLHGREVLIDHQQAEIERLKADKRRLDFLDRMNASINKYNGTNYGWRLVLSHNVCRLMSQAPRIEGGGVSAIDLHDSEGGNRRHKSCRDAIDEALATTEPHL